MDDNKEIFQSGGTSEPKIESASNVNYMDNLYKDMGIASFSNSDNSSYTKFTEKGTNLQNYNFPDINEKNPLSTYEEYGVNVGAGKNYNLERAQKQTGWHNAANFAANLLPKVGFGMVGMAGHLGGILFDRDGDYENALTSWAKESEEYFTADSKNYAENPNASFFSGEYWSDPSNLWDMVDGVVTSAATFAIPGAGATAATSKIALGIANSLAKMTSKAGSVVSGASAYATKLAMSSGTLASSLTMGYAEAAMSGADIYKEQLDKNLAKGMSYDDAKRIASGAAHTTVGLATTFNTILNLPILSSFTKKTDDMLRKEVGDIVDNMNLRSVDKDGNVVDAVTGKRIDASKDLGGVKQMPDEIKNLPKINEVSNLKAAANRISDIKYAPTKWDVAKQYAKEAGLESLEEGQIALAEEAGRKYEDPDGKGQNIIKTLKDAFGGINKSEFWESAVLGALGGVGMKGLIENRPSTRKVQEIDPSITFDPATQTYKTPDGKEVKDNLKRDANGNIIKKTMRAASHDNEQKRQMIASEVAYMAEDLATVDYWQNQIQTIAQDSKANNKVVDYTKEDGTVAKRAMTLAEAKTKLEAAKTELFNLSARRSIMSGRGDNFKVIFQNMLNTSNEDAPQLDAVAEEQINSLKDVITKQKVIVTDDNKTPEEKKAAQEVIDKAEAKIKELHNNLGMSSAQLQGFSTGANDNDYQKRAKQAIEQIDIYTEEYNKLKEAYDYGTVESRQALSVLLQNRMQRHAWTYALEENRKALINKFNELTDKDAKNDYLGWFDELSKASQREIQILENELNNLANDKLEEQEHSEELKKQLEEYRQKQLDNDSVEITKNPTKLAEYKQKHAEWLERQEAQKAKFVKTIEETNAKIIKAEEDVKTKTEAAEIKEINDKIDAAKQYVAVTEEMLQEVNEQINAFSNFDSYLVATLRKEKVNEYKESLISDKLAILKAKKDEYDKSITAVNKTVTELKEALNTNPVDPVKVNDLKNDLINLLKSAQFGFLDLSSLGLSPEKIQAYDYQKLKAALERHSKGFARAVNEVFNSPELQRLNERMTLGLEELDKDFDSMTTKGGHDKLIENAGIIHKRQSKLYLDYINGVNGVYEKKDAPVSVQQNPVVNTPVQQNVTVATPVTTAPEKKNKFGISETKYAEYVNLKTIQQSYEQGIESANLTIAEAKLNIANANGDNKVIIQNEQLIVDSQNKIDIYSKQLSEINKGISSILKDSPFEKINNEANQLKSSITKQYYDDIDKASKDNDSQRSLIWNNLFDAYAKFIQAIDAFKEASLNNIQTFEDNVKADNDRLYTIALDEATAKFEQAKLEAEQEFKKLEREQKIKENAELFKDYVINDYSREIDNVIYKLEKLENDKSNIDAIEYLRQKALLTDDLEMYKELQEASNNYTDSLLSGAPVNDVADSYQQWVIALEKANKQSKSDTNKRFDYIAEEAKKTQKRSDEIFSLLGQSLSTHEQAEQIQKLRTNLDKALEDKLKALSSNMINIIPNIDVQIVNAEKELSDAHDRVLDREIQQEQQELLQQKKEVIKARIEAVKKLLVELSGKKQPIASVNLKNQMRSDLEAILKDVNSSSDIDSLNNRISDVETQTEALINLIKGSKLLSYINNGGSTTFANDLELLDFFDKIGITFDVNTQIFLSGAFAKVEGLSVNLFYDDQNQTRGSYEQNENSINLNAAYLQTPEQAREVVMHELVHAITRQRFMDKNDNIVSKTITVLDKWLDLLGIDKVDSDGKALSVQSKLEKIRDVIKGQNGSNSIYDTFNNIIIAIENSNDPEARLDELYAEAFSNKEFAKMLNSQIIVSDYGKFKKVKTSIWKSFLSIMLEGVIKLPKTLIKSLSRNGKISILNELALILNDNPSLIKTPEEKTKIDAETKQEFDDNIIEEIRAEEEIVEPAIEEIAEPTTQDSQSNEEKGNKLEESEPIDDKQSQISSDLAEKNQDVENEKLNKSQNISNEQESFNIDSVNIEKIKLLSLEIEKLKNTKVIIEQINTNNKVSFFKINGISYFHTNNPKPYVKGMEFYGKIIKDENGNYYLYGEHYTGKILLYAISENDITDLLFEEDISSIRRLERNLYNQLSKNKPFFSGKVVDITQDKATLLNLLKTKLDSLKKELDSLLPTIDLTEQTYVATPTPQQESNNLTELKTGEINNFLPEAPLLPENITNNKITINSNVTPPEEVILGTENGNLVTTRTAVDNVELEEAIENIKQEVSLLSDDIQEEKQQLVNELLQEEGAIETTQIVTPSGEVVELKTINPETQEAIDKVKDNAEAMKQDAENNAVKETKKLTEAANEKAEEPRVVKKAEPKKTKTVKPDSPATINPDSELAQKVDTNKPVIVQDNGDETSTLLPAITNPLSGVPHAILNAEPLAQNVPNSVIKTDTTSTENKTPEKESDTTEGKPIIEKQGFPVNNQGLKDLLLEQGITNPTGQFAITQEPNGAGKALRPVNADGSLGKVLKQLSNEEADSYKKSMTDGNTSNSGFATNPIIREADKEIVTNSEAENKSYNPALVFDKNRFDEWYKNAVNNPDNIDFSNTPVENNIKNQEIIAKMIKDSINKDSIKLYYANSRQLLLDKYNKMDLLEINTDIITNQNMTIHIEKPISVMDNGWTESNDTFVQVFDSVDDFTKNTPFIAIGQGKIDGLKRGSITQVIGITSPLVENNSAKVYLQDIDQTFVGNFQNPNRFTVITFEKQKDGKMLVSLQFLKDDNSFEAAAQNTQLFSYPNDDSESFIENNKQARRLMSNFVDGLGDKETIVLRTPEEKRNYLSDAKLSMRLNDESTKSVQLQPKEITKEFAKSKNGKILFYHRAKDMESSRYGFTSDDAIPDLDGDGKYLFLQTGNGLLPLPVKSKPLVEMTSDDLELLVNLLVIPTNSDTKAITKILNDFVTDNIYIAHGVGNIKLKPAYGLSLKGGKLKLDFYLMYGDNKSINIGEIGLKNNTTNVADLIEEIKGVIKVNIVKDFKNMIVELNEIEEYKSKDGEKSFNNNSPIMSLAGIIKARKSPVPFLSVKYDKNAKFGSVSFSYEMNDDFVKPDEVEEVIDNSTIDNFVNNDFDNQAPEIEMDNSLDDILTDDSFEVGKLQKTIKSIKDKIEEYRSKLTDNALQHTVYDLFDSVEEFKSKYKKIHEYSQKAINEVATIDTLFYSKESPFSYPIVNDGEKGPNRFKEVFETNNEIKQLMNELNDLTNSIVRLINSSETNDVMIDNEDLQDGVYDKTC